MTGATRVLFVGGYGRSGSTIIDLLLDRVPGITSVGEFRHLFGRALGDGELCSCGKPFGQCPHWAEVLATAFPHGYDRERIERAVRAVNRVVVAPRLLHPAWASAALRADLAVYREAFTAVYRAVAEVTGAEVVVDSTKYPLHGLFLGTVPEVDLAVMLLVRDPRAVAHSWTRHRLRPEVHWERREMPRHGVVRSALAWDLSNWLTARIPAAAADRRTQRYEDFMADPAGQLGAIASLALGRPTTVDPAVFGSRRGVPHTIAGNPVRIGSEAVRVRADEAWPEQMAAWQKGAVTASTLPSLRRYGYPVRS